jgi:hypothetical protein
VGLVVTKRFAALHELDAVYSYEDLLNLYEIAWVNSVNEETIREEARK